jgi:hypothetical protein
MVVSMPQRRQELRQLCDIWFSICNFQSVASKQKKIQMPLLAEWFVLCSCPFGLCWFTYSAEVCCVKPEMQPKPIGVFPKRGSQELSYGTNVRSINSLNILLRSHLQSMFRVSISKVI